MSSLSCCREAGTSRQQGDQEAGYSDEEDADFDVGIGEASDSSDDETEPQVSCPLMGYSVMVCCQ